MQRLRVSFSREEELKFLSHLDLMRLWERAFRRAGVALAYSEGFTPHPRISMAAPLSVGVTGEAELMDVFLSRWAAPATFFNQVKPQLPPGLMLLTAQPAGLEEPSLQARVHQAEYEVTVTTEMPESEVPAVIPKFLAQPEIPWEHERDGKVRSYDLRPLVDDIWLLAMEKSHCTLGMRLRCSSAGSGRPEQVTKALGFTAYPHRIHRTKLLFN